MFRLLFSLDGRISRSTYLLIGVGTRIIAVAMAAATESAMARGFPSLGFGWLAMLSGPIMLAGGWISFAAAVKRLHDTDRRGWWLLLELPVAWILYGILTLMFFGIDRSGMAAFVISSMILASGDGTPGPNRFGRQPGSLLRHVLGRGQRAIHLPVEPAAPAPRRADSPIYTHPRRSGFGALHMLLVLTAFFASLYAMQTVDLGDGRMVQAVLSQPPK